MKHARIFGFLWTNENNHQPTEIAQGIHAQPWSYVLASNAILIILNSVRMQIYTHVDSIWLYRSHAGGSSIFAVPFLVLHGTAIYLCGIVHHREGHAVRLSGKCKYRYLRNAKHPPDLPVDGLSHDTRGDMQNDMHGIIL